MRYVNLYNLRIPTGWVRRAKAVERRLYQKLPDERSEMINSNSRIWRDLKGALKELSHNKCWYCETKYSRSDFHVDHFRPKNKLKNYDNTEIEEEGYWWLAFDYTNFRLACSYCNSPHRCSDGKIRGKQNFFPLADASRRCNVGQNLSMERPEILDPTDPLDPLLLWFLDDGRVVPTYSHEADSEPKKIRAKKTVEILNLNSIMTREKRRRLKNTCDFLVRQGDDSSKAIENSPACARSHHEQRLRDVVKQIMNLIEESAEFSSAAKVFLKSSNKPWLNPILERV